MNKKDHTRKPVNRDPLPEKDKITLCELVTWRAIGKAWPARRLKGLMKRNRGQRKPAFLWESFEREAANVVSLCGNGDLSPNGSVDGGPHQQFSQGYFLSDVYAEPVLDSIGPDPLAWPSSGPYPDEPDEEPKELPTYRSVRFLPSDVLSSSGQADQPAAETDQVPGRPERKPVSDKELANWYNGYITLSQDAGIIPIQQADYEAACKHFKDSIVTRIRVRNLRGQIAPKEWRTDTSGPKPKHTAD